MQIDKLPRAEVEKELAALKVAPETVEGEQEWTGPICLGHPFADSTGSRSLKWKRQASRLY